MKAERVLSLLAFCPAAVFIGSSAAAGEELRDSPLRTTLPADRVVLPLELRDVQPVVEARVNGQGPFRFLVDTGAAGCGRISAELADELKLEEVGEIIASDPSGRNTMVVKKVGIDAVALGGALFEDLSMMRHDYKEIINTQREGTHGILGFGLFRDCLVTLDYPGRKLIIERGELPEADGQTVLDYAVQHGIPQITLHVGELEADADIDSGSMGSVSLPQSIAEKLSFKSEPIVVGKASTGFNEFEIREGPLDGVLRIGTHAMTDPTVAVYDIFPRANVGGQFLQHFAMTFDQHNRRVRFTRDEGRPIQMQPRYRVGVMMFPGPDGMIVDGVVPGGAAEKAGLQKGDRITHINGETPGELGPVRMRETFGSPKPIRITVEREGERVELVVTPARQERDG